MRALATLGLGLWLGSGIGITLGTRIAFKLAGGTPLAGQIAAESLSTLSKVTWAAIALIAAAALLGVRGAWLWPVLGAALAFLVSQLAVTPVLRRMRQAAGGSMENLSKDDPQRRRFGMLHGVSMLLLLAQLAGAATATVLLAQ